MTPVLGQIAFSDINEVLGRPPTAQIDFADPTVQKLLMGAKDLDSAHACMYVGDVVEDVDIHEFLADSTETPASYKLLIDSGSVVGGTLGTDAIDVGAFPAGSTVIINNYGSIQGHGGLGGGYYSGGEQGGTAINACYENIATIINNYGSVYGGGGGGGSGGAGGKGGGGYYQSGGDYEFGYDYPLNWIGGIGVYAKITATGEGPQFGTGIQCSTFFWNWIDIPTGRSHEGIIDASQIDYITYIQGSHTSCGGYDGLTYVRGNLRDDIQGSQYYEIGKPTIVNIYTNGGSGGAGGQGGNGKGYDTGDAMDGAGGAGGYEPETNAGWGGAGGKGGYGGSWGLAGAQGDIGLEGGAGNNGGGAGGQEGAGGGSAGYAVYFAGNNATYNQYGQSEGLVG